MFRRREINRQPEKIVLSERFSSNSSFIPAPRRACARGQPKCWPFRSTEPTPLLVLSVSSLLRDDDVPSDWRPAQSLALAASAGIPFSILINVVQSDVFGLFSNNAGRCGPVQTLRRSLGLLWRRSDALDYVGSEALKIRSSTSFTEPIRHDP
jgi:hypothetical protein